MKITYFELTKSLEIAYQDAAEKQNLVQKLECLGFWSLKDGTSYSIELSENEFYNLRYKLQLHEKVTDEELIAALEKLQQEEISNYGQSLEGKVYNAIIPKSLAEYKNYWESPSPQTEFNCIAQLLSDYVINTPYHASPLLHQITHQQYIIWRPNHDTSHSIRQYFFIKKLHELVLVHGSHEFQKVAEKMTNEEMACIELAGYLFRSGRTNELKWGQDLSNQTRSRDIFIDVAIKLNFRRELIDHIAYLMTSARIDKLPGDDIYQGDKDNRLDGYIGTDSEKLLKANLTKKYIDIAHHADLQRCWDVDESPNKDLVFNYLNFAFESLLGKLPAETFAKKLMNFAAQCTVETGNQIFRGGNRYIGYGYPSKDDPEKKSLVNSNVSACIDNLHARFSILNAYEKPVAVENSALLVEPPSVAHKPITTSSPVLKNLTLLEHPATKNMLIITNISKPSQIISYIMVGGRVCMLALVVISTVAAVCILAPSLVATPIILGVTAAGCVATTALILYKNKSVFDASSSASPDLESKAPETP